MGARSEDKDCIVEALKKRPLQGERVVVVEDDDDDDEGKLQEEANLPKRAVGKVWKEDKRGEKGKEELQNPWSRVHLVSRRECVVPRIFLFGLFLR